MQMRRDSPDDETHASAADGLTPAERRIVQMVCRGLTNPQIAAGLSVEPTTVRWHLKNIFRKLGVRTRTQLVASWLQRGRGPSEPSEGDRPATQPPPFVGEERPADRRTKTSQA